MGSAPAANEEVLISMQIAITPVAQARARACSIGGAIRMYTPKESRGFKESLALEIMFKKPRNWVVLENACGISVVATIERPKSAKKRVHPTTKPDCDNYLKAVMDAITAAALWRDDCIVCDSRIQKRYGEPSVSFTIFAM